MTTNTEVLPRPKTKLITGCFFALLMLVVPAYFHTQWFTGPLINALLLLTCFYVGRMEAVIFGLFPSTVALASGLLPLPMAPMIPFIMVGNALLVASFAWLKDTNLFLATTVAAIIKFAVLALAVRLVMADLLQEPLLAKLTIMMSWPQLFTALVGGAIAIGIIKAQQRFQKK